MFVLIQFIPVNRTNPSSDSGFELEASARVMTILKSSCFDCHSNKTTWPIYSYVAPISWLITKDVEEGRNELNFSEWGTYSSEKQLKKRAEIWEEVLEEKMPLKIYLILHKDAKLNADQMKLLREWYMSENKVQ